MLGANSLPLVAPLGLCLSHLPQSSPELPSPLTTLLVPASSLALPYLCPREQSLFLLASQCHWGPALTGLTIQNHNCVVYRLLRVSAASSPLFASPSSRVPTTPESTSVSLPPRSLARSASYTLPGTLYHLYVCSSLIENKEPQGVLLFFLCACGLRMTL